MVSAEKENKDRKRTSQAKFYSLEMATPGSPATMENLPRDIISNIFIRLLAKQLAQMRCVCKPWNALLSESSFVKSHLHRSISHNDHILMFVDNGADFDRNSFPACPSRTPGLKMADFIKLPVDPRSKYSYGRLIGSVNGLICFSYGYYSDPVIYIWNPSLSALLTLPPYSLPSSEIQFGFGFDPKTDDYKVIKIKSLFRPTNKEPPGEVYSMRKGSWESISQRFPSHISRLWDQNQVCVDGHNGHLHWLGYTDEIWKPKTIVAFNLGAETFCEIPLPDSILHNGRYHCNSLGVLAGRLCVMSRVRDGECEVWVMDEYGVPGSWVKHHAFPWFRPGDICPYGFTSRNEFLFRFNDVNHDGLSHYFGLYDPIVAKTKTFKVLLKKSFITTVIEYVDSLVWIAPANRS